MGEPETIQSFGPLTVAGDKTFSATANCEEPPAPKNPETNPEPTIPPKASENGSG